MRFLVEVKVGREAVQMNACVLLEQERILRICLDRTQRAKGGLFTSGGIGRVTALSNPVVEETTVVGTRVVQELERKRYDLPHGGDRCVLNSRFQIVIRDSMFDALMDVL